MLYAREITLRNCGRFTHISSDFGADYRTHTHVTSEALYASLTREVTRRRPRFVDLKNDVYDFAADYDVAAMPVWFLPGIFMEEDRERLVPERLDTSFFNVISSVYPSTSRSFGFVKGELKVGNRSHRVPTFGCIQAVLPGNLLLTAGLSPNESLLAAFVLGQTFLLGKKRTMFQVVALSDVGEGRIREGQCTTGYLQLPPNSSTRFQSFEVLAATMRYVILRGTTREEAEYVEFPFSDGPICLPDFYLRGIPLRFADT